MVGPCNRVIANNGDTPQNIWWATEKYTTKKTQSQSSITDGLQPMTMKPRPISQQWWPHCSPSGTNLKRDPREPRAGPGPGPGTVQGPQGSPGAQQHQQQARVSTSPPSNHFWPKCFWRALASQTAILAQHITTSLLITLSVHPESAVFKRWNWPPENYWMAGYMERGDFLPEPSRPLQSPPANMHYLPKRFKNWFSLY